jgi:transposase-like protein
MTEVQMGDEVITTDLPPEAVADLQTPPAEQPQEPAKEPEKPTEQPVETPDEEPQKPVEAPKAEEPPRDSEGRFTKKATPIAKLLERSHQAEERATQAEAKAAELEAQLQKLSTQAPSVQTDDKIKALAEKHGIDAEVLADIVATARDGLSPELPKEVQELIKERAEQKQQQAEQAAFDTRLASLAKTFPSEQFNDPKVKEKLMELAYSTEKAPDGEPYYQKELSELYFAYIKPEVEPGRVSAESPTGGKSGNEILDFEQIHGDEARLEEFAKSASSEQWASYAKWRDEKQGDVKITRKTI